MFLLFSEHIFELNNSYGASKSRTDDKWFCAYSVLKNENALAVMLICGLCRPELVEPDIHAVESIGRNRVNTFRAIRTNAH